MTTLHPMKARLSNVLRLNFLVVLAIVAGCRTAAPLQPVNLQEPGWTIRQGQALWTREQGAQEIAGEILVASRPDGSAFVQFTKNPFPLVTAQNTPTRWQVETPTEGKRYSGRGNPPKRLLFLYVPRALAGRSLPSGWTWEHLPNGGWLLANPDSGQSLEIHFSTQPG